MLRSFDDVNFNWQWTA